MVPIWFTTNVPSCVKHLYNFEKNLDDVLVAVESGTFARIERQEEYVHEFQTKSKGLTFVPLIHTFSSTQMCCSLVCFLGFSSCC